MLADDDARWMPWPEFVDERARRSGRPERDIVMFYRGSVKTRVANGRVEVDRVDAARVLRQARRELQVFRWARRAHSEEVKALRRLVEQPAPPVPVPPEPRPAAGRKPAERRGRKAGGPNGGQRIISAFDTLCRQNQVRFEHGGQEAAAKAIKEMGDEIVQGYSTKHIARLIAPLYRQRKKEWRIPAFP